MSTVSPSPFRVVGIGASAGGLAAFDAFFSGMAPGSEPGMAFVLVQHLAPEHKSLLVELLQRCTTLPVELVSDGVRVRPNVVYVIPPNRDMALHRGVLHLLEPVQPHGLRLPIDYFFASLAQDQQANAVGIVLSGTGRDGAQGLCAIKAAGGLTLAQTPDSSEFAGMPQSALATGQVDVALAPADMPARLMRPRNAVPAHPFTSSTPPDMPDSEMGKIFVLLRTRTGHDFALYKPNTMHRRVQRRMAALSQVDVASYVHLMQSTPTEIDALFRDLLIGVTSFFRDPDVFAAVAQQALPTLLAAKALGETVRIWCAGCSTGEEAYSMAMLVQECMDASGQQRAVQVFATDLDGAAIATARAGMYAASLVAGVTPERLSRFFTAEQQGAAYRVCKGIRDMVVFSEQDVIKDPPFSRLDLISCRNLLIYFGAELQKRLLPLFHYALSPKGMLLLGSSESVGEQIDLFSTVDRVAKLYQRKDGFRTSSALRFLPIKMTHNPTPGKPADPIRPGQPKVSLRVLTEQALLQQVAPASALVNEAGDILYLHGRMGMYLEHPPGEVGVSNVLQMARQGLKPELTVALRKAATSGQAVRRGGLRVKTNGHHTHCALTVRPLTAGQGKADPAGLPLFLVILEEMEQTATAPFKTDAGGEPSEVADLKAQLQAKDEYLQSANEELESSNEELRSANEEMQSVNEELQSANEELETSKEELQSVNEELTTVNTELQAKVADLSRASNDMNNLLAGTGIATVFLDRQLNVLRFTPMATQIINLIQSDVGRPLEHMASNLLGYITLVADVQSVLDTLAPKEVDVQAKSGLWYTMRVLPYRTLDNVIEGAVITFVDISDMKRTALALSKAHDLERMAAVVRDAFDAITVQDLEGHILAWNPGAQRMYGWTEAEALKLNVRERIPAALRQASLARLTELSRATTFEADCTQRVTRDGTLLDVWVTATALINEAGQIYALATTERQGQCPPNAPAP